MTMERSPVSGTDVVRQLRNLGVQMGGLLVVHTGFSRVKPVDGGPSGLIAALHEAVGREGTLVMPSMTSDDEHPFDLKSTPCPDMGIIADTFWRLPGVARSDSPHAFAAVGPLAERITAEHPIDEPHGLDSPIGRAYELDAQVLLLGVGHDANTTVHLAEDLAGVRYRREKHITVLAEGGPVRLDYTEIDHCCERFNLVDDWLNKVGLQRTGPVGHGKAKLARSRDIVGVVMEQIRRDETVFLHLIGHDEQCDEAWKSLQEAGGNAR